MKPPGDDTPLAAGDLLLRAEQEAAIFLRLWVAVGSAWGGLLATLAWLGAPGWILVPLGAGLASLSLLLRQMQGAGRPARAGQGGCGGGGAPALILAAVQGIYLLFVLLGLYFAILPFLRGKVPGWDLPPVARIARAGTPPPRLMPYPKGSPRPFGTTSVPVGTPRIVLYPPGATPPGARPPGAPATGAGPARPMPMPYGARPLGTPGASRPTASVPPGATPAPAPPVAPAQPASTPAPPTASSVSGTPAPPAPVSTPAPAATAPAPPPQ